MFFFFFHLFLLPGNIRDRQDHILQLLDMHCNSDSHAAKDGDANLGYLVLMRCEMHCQQFCSRWSGDTIHVKPTAETTISLSQIEVKRPDSQTFFGFPRSPCYEPNRWTGSSWWPPTRPCCPPAGGSSPRPSRTPSRSSTTSGPPATRSPSPSSKSRSARLTGEAFRDAL